MTVAPTSFFAMLVILLNTSFFQAKSQGRDSLVKVAEQGHTDSIALPETDSLTAARSTQTNDNHTIAKPKRRLVAAFLCVALGPFGMHRLYLGTKPHVAAAYTLTLGGGIGLVPLIDLFHIVFDPNLDRYKDNNRFIMWLK